MSEVKIDLSQFKTVAALLEDPNRWTKGMMARDGYGWRCKYSDLEACSFCLIGAIFKVYGENDVSEEIKRKVISKLGVTIDYWNDDEYRTHGEVLALCKELEI